MTSARECLQDALAIANGSVQPEYSPWRHGGWYVDNLRYPSGAVGCVARFNNGRTWQIACDGRDTIPSFNSRDEAARAEAAIIIAECIAAQISARVTVGLYVEDGNIQIRASEAVNLIVFDRDTFDCAEDDERAEMEPELTRVEALPEFVADV